MTISTNGASLSNSEKSDAEKLDLACEELKIVEQKLREMRKILNRDWEEMSPRQRSAQSRIVKEIETQRRNLQETIESSGTF